MKYIVDRIEDNIVILETETKEIIELNKNILPNSIHEGSIIKYENEKYLEIIDEEIEKRKKIEERFKRLRRN